ncbi:MAG: ABC transporter substrate-binding protein [Rhodobacteraceae bacterium]|nr:ABC transporter substrate-binding protein [Paracoccaceae bacterium]
MVPSKTDSTRRAAIVGGAATIMGGGATALTLASARGQSEKVLRVAIGGFPAERGNAFANIQTPSIVVLAALFDGLTRLKHDGTVSPWLATAWTQIDPLTWRFTLREGVVFSNGKPCDAAAVAGNIDYLSGPGPATEGVRREMLFLDGARVVDASTVEIKTTHPVPMLPRYAAVLPIVDIEAWHAMGPEQFSLTPVGTGPFVAESWGPARIELRANRSSWRKPKIDAIEYINLPDAPPRLAGLQSGRIDVAYQVAPEDFSEVERIGGSIFTLRDGSATNIVFLFGEGRETPLNDVRVRRALNLGVDLDRIIKQLLGGRTTVSSQPTVAAAFGYDPDIEPYTYDPDAARALLREAGYADGFAITLQTSGFGTSMLAIIQQIANDWAQIGVNVTVQMKPVIRYLTDFVRGRYEADAMTLQWGAYPTLDSIQMTNLSSCRKTVPWYCDQAIQPVIEEAWLETDPDKALALRRQVMRYYHDQAPGLFLFEGVAFIGLSARTRGFDSVFGIVAYDQITLDEPG